MTAFINILLSFALVFGGIVSQTDFLLHPEKYNAKTLEVSELPEAVTEPGTGGVV